MKIVMAINRGDAHRDPFRDALGDPCDLLLDLFLDLLFHGSPVR